MPAEIRNRLSVLSGAELTQQRGVKLARLTGNNRAIAERIGKELGIDIVLADVLPGQKAEKVKDCKRKGTKSEWWATASTMRPP